MTRETMTVHKALCEMKMLNKRISKAIADCPYVIANKANNEKIDGASIKEFEEDVKQRYQSIRDMMTRLNAINAAVAQSNATTKIMDDKYTVAEAMAVKNKMIPLKNQMLTVMAHKLKTETNKVDYGNEQAERDADSFVGNNTSGKSDVKNLSDEAIKMRQNYINMCKMELIDPLDLAKEMTKLDEELDAFMSDLDSALSVSNATTNIIVEY